MVGRTRMTCFIRCRCCPTTDCFSPEPQILEEEPKPHQLMEVTISGSCARMQTEINSGTKVMAGRAKRDFIVRLQPWIADLCSLAHLPQGKTATKRLGRTAAMICGF